jgi:hypothetical protein
VERESKIRNAAAEIVTLLPTDEYPAARDRLMRLLAADGSAPPVEITLLDDGRQSLLDARPAERAEIAAETRGAIQALLRLRLPGSPDFADRLLAALGELRARNSGDVPARVHQIAKATGNARVYQAGRDIGAIGRDD